MRLFRNRAVAVAARPGTLVEPPESPPPRVTFVDYTIDTVRAGTVDDPTEVRALLDAASVTWIDVQGLGDVQTTKTLGRVLGLHDLLLEDVAHVPQRPKVAEYDEHLLLVARRLRWDPERRVMVRPQVSIIIRKPVRPRSLFKFMEVLVLRMIEPLDLPEYFFTGTCHLTGIDHGANLLHNLRK